MVPCCVASLPCNEFTVAKIITILQIEGSFRPFYAEKYALDNNPKANHRILLLIRKQLTSRSAALSAGPKSAPQAESASHGLLEIDAFASRPITF